MVGRLIALVVVAAAWGSGHVAAQDDLNRGRTAAQLFASDCAECHRNPRALDRRDPGTLTNFLRLHYTASRDNARALAAYLISLGPDPRASRPAAPPRRRAAPPQSQTAQPAAEPSEAAAPKSAAPTPEQLAAAPSSNASGNGPAAPVTPPAAPANPE
jgi:hypothetical protein